CNLLIRLSNRVFNPKPNNLDRRFRIYRETLSRFSCAASLGNTSYRAPSQFSQLMQVCNIALYNINLSNKF
ncbi:hypothetical protein ACTMNS_12460, partial [Staphylococcus haemolyticus]